MTEPIGLRRLARAVHLRVQLRAGLRRLRESLPAAVQIVVAALASYAVARYLLGHPTPLIAVTVTITSLGIARDARPRRVLDIALGVTIGIALSEVIVLGLGRGIWQLAIVLFATLLVTRAVSPNPAFAVAAAVQSTLVVLLPDPVGGPFTRSLDALVAGVVALAATALIPRDPRGAALRDARRLFSVFAESLDGLVDALRTGNNPAAELALERLRRTQALIDDWDTSLESATAIARLSPWLRRHLPELAAQRRVLAASDLASRHLRTIARRIVTLAGDGADHGELADLMAELTNAVALVGRETVERQFTGVSRSALAELAGRLDPHVLRPDGELRESVLIVLVRPLVIDLLVGLGMPIDRARALLPDF